MPNKYCSTRESIDRQHMLALLFKIISPRLVFWLTQTSKGFIIYPRKVTSSYILVTASNVTEKEKLSAICFKIVCQNLVLQQGRTRNPAAWHHIYLNRIQWASNLVKPENYLIHVCYHIGNHFGGYCIFIIFLLWGKFHDSAACGFRS